MEKEIKIEMDQNFDIKIILNENIKKEIKKEDRRITALDIFESLDIDYESKYKLLPMQEKGEILEAQYDVLKSFYEIYKKIISEINLIIESKENL